MLFVLMKFCFLRFPIAATGFVQLFWHITLVSFFFCKVQISNVHARMPVKKTNVLPRLIAPETIVINDNIVILRPFLINVIILHVHPLNDQ